ncbi:MAG: tetratricopeptide repeat protein [Elusimicrobia bacterium]|nr:tetratricopeptide repeat protein [Elusimicrobiota bacterium]
MRLIVSLWLAGGAPALAVVEAPDLELLRQETAVKQDLQDKIQFGILDPVLGKDKAKAFVDLELDFVAKRQENIRVGQGLSERNREKAGARGAAATDFIVPGVPRQKSVASLANPTRPEASQAQLVGVEKHENENIFNLKLVKKALLVTIIHDGAMPEEMKKTLRGLIVDAGAKLKLAPDEIVFRQANFNAHRWLDDLKDPRVWVPMIFALLFLLLLLYLFGPLRRVLWAAVSAIQAKKEQEVKLAATLEEVGEDEGEGGGGEGEGEEDDFGFDQRELDIMIGRKPPEPPPPPPEPEPPLELEEEMKKFEPFNYITEDKLVNLANLFLVRREEPWLVAVVLSYLRPEFARQVLASLPLELQAKVALEAFRVRQVTKEQLEAIDEEVKKNVDFVVGGLARLIQMLEEADNKTRENILEYLKNEKPTVYERVRKSILTFDDIAKFPDREMQTIIRELKAEFVARALQGAAPDVVAKFLKNMSAGAAATLKENMEYAKGLTSTQIDEERAKIIDQIKTMEKQGKVAVRDRSAEAEGVVVELATERVERITSSSAPAKGPVALPAPAAAAAANPQQLLSVGVQAHDAGNFDAAVANLREAIDRDPALWQAYQYMGSALYQMGRSPEAFVYFDKLVELNPDPEVKAWVESFKAQAGV